MQQSPCANVSGNAFDRAEEGEPPFPACGRGNMDVDWRNARHDADAKDAEGGTFTHSLRRLQVVVKNLGSKFFARDFQSTGSNDIQKNATFQIFKVMLWKRERGVQAGKIRKF